jgi:serine/threonine protein kinase
MASPVSSSTHGTTENRQKSMRYSDPVFKQSYVYKEGRTLKMMRRKRFLSLRGRILSHHRDTSSPATWEGDASTFTAIAGAKDCELVISFDGRSMSFFTKNRIDLEDWIYCLKIARNVLSDWYRIEKPIGKGSYGTVYLGFDVKSNEQVAYVILKVKRGSEDLNHFAKNSHSALGLTHCFSIKVIKKNPASSRQTKFIER